MDSARQIKERRYTDGQKCAGSAVTGGDISSSVHLVMQHYRNLATVLSGHCALSKCEMAVIRQVLGSHTWVNIGAEDSNFFRTLFV